MATLYMIASDRRPRSSNFWNICSVCWGFWPFSPCADGRVVGNHGAQEASELQLLEHMQRILWLLALLACADGRVIGDHGAQEASELQLLQQRRHQLWLWVLLTCDDGRIVGGNFCNRGGTRCGFWPFWQALTKRCR